MSRAIPLQAHPVERATGHPRPDSISSIAGLSICAQLTSEENDRGNDADTEAKTRVDDQVSDLRVSDTSVGCGQAVNVHSCRTGRQHQSHDGRWSTNLSGDGVLARDGSGNRHSGLGRDGSGHFVRCMRRDEEGRGRKEVCVNDGYQGADHQHRSGLLRSDEAPFGRSRNLIPPGVVLAAVDILRCYGSLIILR